MARLVDALGLPAEHIACQGTPAPAKPPPVGWP